MIKKLLAGLGIGICAAVFIVLLYQTPFILGRWGNKIEATVGTEYKDIKREQFENSKSYVHGKIDDLQRYKRELERAADPVERQAIVINIQDEFSNFDESKIDNDNLREFLNDIRNGVIE